MKLHFINKSIGILNKVFIILVFLDIIGCWLLESYDYMCSSIILITGLLIAKGFIAYNKYKWSILFTIVTLYVVGFFHVTVIHNYVTFYFILLVSPIVAALVLDSKTIKIMLIVISSILFFVCNYLAGLKLFDNYIFFLGLFPVSFMMNFFYKELQEVTAEKNRLIHQLEEKNEEILLYSNMMSHDLKAPLRSIEGFSSILQKRLKNLSDDDAEMFGFIIKGVQSMKKLIGHLLQYAKTNVDDYHFEQIDVNKLVEKIIITFNYDINKKNVKVKKSNLNTVYGNEEVLTLVFQNLISNAIKFQPKSETHIPQIAISQVDEQQKNKIIIKDNGIGLNEVEVQEIFTPFRRFHTAQEYEGTGLGMSIVRKVIDRHRGVIEVESKLGEGTTFIITLPKKKFVELKFK